MKKIKFYKRIGFRLTAILIILVIISSIIGGTISFFEGKNAIEERVENHLESIVILKENQINSWLKEKTQEIEIFTENRLVVESIIDMFRHHQKGELAKPHKKLLQFLELQNKKHPGFLEIFILDSEGTIHLSTDATQEGKIKANEPYFIEGKEKTYVQNIFYDVSLQLPAIIISSPIKYNNETQAVLAVRLNLNKLSRIMLERSGLGETGETYLVNKFNYAITELKFDNGAIFKKTIYTPQAKDCLAGNSGHKDDVYNYKDKKVISTYMWFPENEICLIAEINEGEAFDSILKLRNIIILINLILVFLLATIGHIFTKTVTTSLHKLHRGTEIISQGKLDYKVGTAARDEIGQLSRAFDQMVQELKKSRSKLQQYSKELEIKVKERTTELEEKVLELERFSKLATGRELKMVELKKEIGELKNKLGQQNV